MTNYSKILLSYEFYGETTGYFIRPYIEYNGKNVGENVNPVDDTVEFDVSKLSGNITIGIRFIVRSNSDIEENDTVSVKLHYGLGFVN